MPITIDDRDEENECFKVRIVNLNGAVLGNSVETVTILDDYFYSNGSVSNPAIPEPCENNEVNSEPVISINSLSVTEGNDATLTISLSQANLTQNVVVDYMTVNGSAMAVSDYVAKSGTIVFSPGEIEKTKTFVTVEDTTSESTEVFTVELSNPQRATLSQSTGTVTIDDDD